MNLGNIIEKAKLKKPACIIVTGDFNARHPLFWEEGTETWEGWLFRDFTVSNCLEEPTHIREMALKLVFYVPRCRHYFY